MKEIKKKIKVIENFVKSRIAQGISEEEIRAILKEKCWPEKIIDKIFSDIYYKRNMKKEGENLPRYEGNTVMIIDSVTKQFKQNRVIDNISLKVKRGDFLGILGLSGSGKTTLLSMAIGYLEPDEGNIFYHVPGKENMVNLQESFKEITKTFGFAPQKPSFYKRLTVWENLDYFGSLYNLSELDREKAAFSLLEFLNLEKAKETRAGNLSGGMQRRLGIACALIHNPPILILDEPTADLDPILRKDIWDLILEINKQGKTVIVTSHLLSEVEDLCNKIAIINGHNVVAYGTPNELKEKYSHSEEIHIKIASYNYDPIIKELQKQDFPLSHVVVKNDKLVIYTTKAEPVLHFLMHVIEMRKEKVIDIELNKPSLNEVFESFVTGNIG